MQRLISVTSLYLKFTFACMLGGTAIFFLAGLAITDLKVFLIVMTVAVAAFLVVRMEVKSHRHARALGEKNNSKDKNKAEVKALIEYLALAEATSMVFLSVSDEIRMMDAPSLWVSEWDHTYDPRAIPSNVLLDRDLLEATEMSLATKSLARHQKELAAYGIHTISVSKKPADQIVRTLQWPQRIVVSHATSKAGHPITIIFLHEKGGQVRVELVENLLKGSFRIIRDTIVDPKPDSTTSTG
jgi:hypothetical protein